MIYGCILILTAIVSQVAPFFIIKADPSLVVVSPGDKVTLFCEVDDHYEYCKFISPQKNKNNESLICDLEWKRKANNITMQDCDDFKDKNVEFHGAYDDYQCGITFIASEADSGLWECEIEEYVLGGSRGSGRKDNAHMNVTVIAKPAPTSTTVSTTYKTTTPTTKTTTVKISSSTTTSTTLTSKVTTEPVSEVPDAVPHTNNNEADSAGMTSTVVAILSIIIIVACVGVAGWYYRRRQRRRPDADAAVVFDRESKVNNDTTNMMRHPHDNISDNTRLSQDISIRDLHVTDHRNLHEFFPNSDSFA